MDNKSVITGRGVKVTYIETQFVTSDAAGFKDLVQRLTGRSATPPVPHRPRPCRRDYDYGGRGTAAAGADAGQGYRYAVAETRPPAVITSRTPPYLHEDGMGGLLQDIDMCDFSDFFYVGASHRSDGGGSPY